MGVTRARIQGYLGSLLSESLVSTETPLGAVERAEFGALRSVSLLTVHHRRPSASQHYRSLTVFPLVGSCVDDSFANGVKNTEGCKMMHTMSEHAGGAGGLGVSVLPFDGMGLYEQRRPRFMFKVPRVVPEQKGKFETDELFRRLSRESEVRYTGFRDRPVEERRVRFQNGCREGHTEIAFAATGTNLQLVFGGASGNYAVDANDCDFEKDCGKVHLRAQMILNGVCVLWRGWIDLERLDGVGCLEFDEKRAAEENAILRDQVESYSQRQRELDEKQRAYRSGAPHLNHHHHHHHHHHGHHGHHVTAGAGTGATVGIEPHLTHRQDPEMEVRLRAY